MKKIHTEAEFNEIIQSKAPVIVKFTADWCPDCKRMDMFIHILLEEFKNYHWYEVNNDEIEGLAEKNDVMGIPSVLVFQNGAKLGHQHSAHTKSPESVSAFLNEHLDGKTTTPKS